MEQDETNDNPVDEEGFKPVFVLCFGPDRRFKWVPLEPTLDHGLMATAAIDFLNIVQKVTEIARKPKTPGGVTGILTQPVSRDDQIRAFDALKRRMRG